MSESSGGEWVGTPLDVTGMEARGIEKIVVEFDEGAEVITPRLNERFGSYDLYEASHYLHTVSAHVAKGRDG